ncbi:MAG: hypothetical protein Q9191_007751, partial [Dirinaria sp. TL-2023a]
MPPFHTNYRSYKSKTNEMKKTNSVAGFTGAWTIHILLIALLKILFSTLSLGQETSWTLTNITYMFGSYLMFHYVQGVPFEFNAGAYDNLNMWEQIDNGDQYTPTKKFLLITPVVLFLLSTHYTHYEGWAFMVNFLATMGVVIPKLPS